jgi:ketol-acid reductoisomerase
MMKISGGSSKGGREVSVIYTQKDVDARILNGRTIAVIGYGSQGRAQALNLRDSGCAVVVADLPGSAAWQQAREDGFGPVTTSRAAAQAQMILLLVPDSLHGDIFRREIQPALTTGDAMVFAHAFSVHYGQVAPPDDVDCLLVAPKGPGLLVRHLYRKGQGIICLLAVHQDASGQARALGLAVAAGIGAARAGIISTTFAEETETDLFGEQALLCGGLSALIKAGFETLVDAGYAPEVAYFECLHEIKQIADMIYAHGIQGMRRRISETARYGDLTRGPRIITQQTRQRMAEILKEIRDGRFAREWLSENEAGRPNLERMARQDDDHPIEAVGERLRRLMPWIDQPEQR